MKVNNAKLYSQKANGQYIPLCSIDDIVQVDFDRNNNQEIYKPSFQSTGEYSFTAKAYNYPYGFTPFHVILAEKLINDTIKSSNHGSKIWHLAVNSKKSVFAKRI